MDYDTLPTLQSIARHCRLCQYEAAGPHRFKFTLRDAKLFNQNMKVDTLATDRRPVLHVLDQGTRYQAARCQSSVNAETIRRAL